MKKIAFVIAAVLVVAATIYSCAPRVYKNAETTTPATPSPQPQKAEPTTEPAPAPAPPPPSKAAELNILTPKEKSEGWTLLFDGTSTDGWHAYGSKTIGTAWKVANGALYFDATQENVSKSNGDIVSDKEYKNFELQIDWKIDKKGNSGICIYVNENKNKYQYMWSTAPEIQIVDNDGHPDGALFKHQAGDLYDLIPAKQKAANAPLEWNKYLIRCVNGVLDVYLNDVHVVNTTLWNDNWRNLIAGSKFKNMQDFGTYKSGRIGLQDHGNNVWFRNIKIREL